MEALIKSFTRKQRYCPDARAHAKSEVESMQIDSKSEIAGLPALDLRAFLRETKHSSHWDVGFFQESLSLSPRRAKTALSDLEAEGYVEPTVDPKGLWRNTSKGNALASASAATPLHRESAELKLKQFLDRVDHVNSEGCEFVYWIEEVVLLGSMLSDKQRVSDIDLSVLLKPKLEGDEHWRASKARSDLAQENGRSFPNYVDQLYWPENEVWRYLKNRSRSISLIEWNENWFKTQPHKFIYRRGQGRMNF